MTLVYVYGSGECEQLGKYHQYFYTLWHCLHFISLTMPKQNLIQHYLTTIYYQGWVMMLQMKSRSQESPLFLTLGPVCQLERSWKLFAEECIQWHWRQMGLSTPGDATTSQRLGAKAQKMFLWRSTCQSQSMIYLQVIHTLLLITHAQTKFFIGDAPG